VTDFCIQDKNTLKVGFLINPYAGLGGPMANKGSDNLNLEAFIDTPIEDLRASQRALRFLQCFILLMSKYSKNKELDLGEIDPEFVSFLTVQGAIGGDVLTSFHAEHDLKQLKVDVLPRDYRLPSTADDTKDSVIELCRHDIDVLCFVGGDGTARNIYDALLEQKNRSPVVLGIPAGVKMHSDIFAIDPDCAAHVLYDLLIGNFVSLDHSEIRDIDEGKLRKGIVNSKFYGRLVGVSNHDYIQSVKQGGLEVEELVLMDIAEEIKQRVAQLNESNSNCLFIFSPGTTTQFIAKELYVSTSSDNSLLGFDVYLNEICIAKDADQQTLSNIVGSHEGDIRLLITPIGGQGYLLGRGNQQLSVDCLKRIGRDRLWVVSTKSKLQNLKGKPLLMDSNSAELDKAWAGVIPIITGYNDEILYRLGLS